MVIVLKGHGLLGSVINELPCPGSTILDDNGALNSNPAAAKWLRLDQLILDWINSSLSDAPLSQVINSETSQAHGKFLKLCMVDIHKAVFSRCVESCNFSQKAHLPWNIFCTSSSLWPFPSVDKTSLFMALVILKFLAHPWSWKILYIPTLQKKLLLVFFFNK